MPVSVSLQISQVGIAPYLFIQPEAFYPYPVLTDFAGLATLSQAFMFDLSPLTHNMIAAWRLFDAEFLFTISTLILFLLSNQPLFSLLSIQLPLCQSYKTSHMCLSFYQL